MPVATRRTDRARLPTVVGDGVPYDRSEFEIPLRGVIRHRPASSRERSFATWLSRKVLRVPIGGLEGLLCGQRVLSAPGPVGVGCPESLSSPWASVRVL
jgi:hypothetical protein